MSKNCPDCYVLPGQKHDPSCDVARCSGCKAQRLSCGCEDGDGGVWEGEWPGVIECRERGWYAVLIPGRGWYPVPPGTPGAMEDLNRLAYFKQTGKDELYKGR